MIDIARKKEQGRLLVHPDLKRTVEFFAAIAKERSQIILEGPPMYSSPSWDNPAQAWDSVTVAGGWNTMAAIAGVLKFVKGEKDLSLKEGVVKHWVLIDDCTNDNTKNLRRRPDIGAETLEGVQESLPSPNPILEPENIAEQILQSTLEGESSKQLCSNIDATFQLKKLDSVLKNASSIFQLPLFVVVHPQEFKQQQLNMLQELVNLMGANERITQFKQLPKERRKSLVSGIYRHVWVGHDGRIMSITQPNFSGGSLSHIECSF